MRKVLIFLLCFMLAGCTTVPAVTTGDSAVTVSAEVTAEPVRVAVIDTGFSDAIPAENTASGANYLTGNGDTEDTYGHGTAMASLILRYAPDAVLVPLVSTRYEKGRLTHVTAPVLAQMLRDAVDVYDCRILNVSAGLALDDPQLRSAVEYCREKGILIGASAGNDYETNPQTPYYPAAYESVLAVGALGESKQDLAAFSQRGPWVDLYGPGVGISVTTLSGANREEWGTSYAAAQICGAAAALLAQDPDLTARQLEEAILAQAEPLPGGELAWQGEEKETEP